MLNVLTKRKRRENEKVDKKKTIVIIARKAIQINECCFPSPGARFDFAREEGET